MPEGVPFTHGTTTSAPTTLAPTTLAPTTLAPTTTQLQNPNPPSDVVVVPAPIGTTLAPTTIQPTTIQPTTLAPTTLAPTTLAPVYPTTSEPTTTFAPVPELWSPKDLNLSAWYDAKDFCSVVVDQNSKVSKWRDKSGENNHATQSVPSRRLTYLESDPLAGDKPSLQSLSHLGRIGLEIPSFSMKEVFMVLYYDDSTDEDFDQYNIILSSTGTYGKHRIMGLKNEDDLSDSSQWSFNSQTFKNGSSLSSNEVLPLPNSVMRFVSNSALDEQRFLFFGTYTNAIDRGWKGSVCEIIALPDSPTSADVEKIEGYLAHKWGLEGDLPSSHNFKTSAPTEIILPENHSYSLTMSNACSAGGIDFIESALDLRMTAPTIGGEGFFEQGGEVLVFSKEHSTTPEEIEPDSDLPSDLSSINWLDYFPYETQLSINNFSSFYSRTLNDFGVIKPQNDQVWLSFKYYFISDNSVLSSGNCEIFVDHPTCTTTNQPTTTLDPTIPTTTSDPSQPTTTEEPFSWFPQFSVSPFAGCYTTQMGGVDEIHIQVLLGIDSQWTNFAVSKWYEDGQPSGEYYNYIEKYSMNNHVIDFEISQGGTAPIQKTIALSSADFSFYNWNNSWQYRRELGRMLTEKIDIDLSLDLYYSYEVKLRHHAEDEDGFAIGEVIPDGWHNETRTDSGFYNIDPESLCIPPTSTTEEPYNPTTTCPPAKYQVGDIFYDSSGMYEIQNQGWWYSTCTPTYDLFFYDYMIDYDHCAEVGISAQNIYGVMDSDLDLKSQSINFAKNQGWISCPTTSTSTTITSTTSNPSAFQVGDMTCWYGVSVQIAGDNGDGTFNIDNNNGAISYNISASALGTDIDGNQTNNC